VVQEYEGHGRSRVFGARGCLVLLACTGAALPLGIAAASSNSVPSFAATTSYATGRLPASVAIGDLNGDAKPDLVTPNVQSHSLSVLLNRGAGRFETRRDYRTGRWPISVALGDLNGDRKLDLATASREASTVSVLLNTGNGRFAAALDYPSRRFLTSIATGDLNGDGKGDLAIANGAARNVSVLLNRGDGSFQARRVHGSGRFPNSIAIGDLNGDGARDLAVANWSAKSISVLLNRGDGSFRAKHDYRTGRFPNSIALGDLNGDRKLDVATADSDADFPLVPNTVSVLLNRGGGSFLARRDYRTADDPRWIAVGDLSGDGKTGPGHRGLQHRQRLRTCEHGRRQVSAPARVPNRSRRSKRAELGFLARAWRSEWRRQARPRSRKTQREQSRGALRLDDRCLRCPRCQGPLFARRAAGGRARPLPPRKNPPRLLEGRHEGAGDFRGPDAAHGSEEGRQGQPRRQPRPQTVNPERSRIAPVTRS
jgi:hypothetical protein